MNNIDIVINGEPNTVVSNTSLATVLSELVPEQGAFAVAVNEQFVPKSAYSSTQLVKGDRIELLVPMQGG